jgi:hypothetical protein
MTQSQNIHTQQNSAKYAKGNSLTKQTQAKIRQLLKLPTDEIGKAVIALVLFIFVINIHFILFLRLKEQQHSPMMSVQSYFKNLTFSNTSSDKMLFFARTSERHIVLECSSDLGTWYIKFLEEVWFWVDMLVYFMVPFITMCITFSIISFKLKSINENYASCLHENHSNTHNKLKFVKKIRRNRKIIQILLAINVYFCLSILPFFTFTIFKENEWYSSIRDNHKIKTFVEILFYSNNAFNFFFYGITSKDYRSELTRIFQKDCRVSAGKK